MLLEPTPSPYDLRWRMFGIPVRVHPTFWLLCAFTGWPNIDLGIPYFLLWMGCVFVSILVHELGHISAGLLCGQRGHIVLYSFGGLAIGNYHQTYRWQRIFISFAGPGAGFLLYGLVLVVENLIRMRDPLLIRWTPRLDVLRWDPTAITYLGGMLYFLKFINLLWGLMNLLPIFPLDGGQISREVCMMFSRRNGLRFSLGLSFLIAGVIAIYSAIVSSRPPGELWFPKFGFLQFDPLFTVIMFVLSAVQSFVTMKSVEREQRRWENDQDPW